MTKLLDLMNKLNVETDFSTPNRVKISYDGRSGTFDYSHDGYEAGRVPDDVREDALQWLLADAAVLNKSGLDEFTADTGYTDHALARKAYNHDMAQSRKLVRVLGDEFDLFNQNRY